MIELPTDWQVFPASQYCRVCGCTEDSPCAPEEEDALPCWLPCWWAEPDLCSSCVGRPEPGEPRMTPGFICSTQLDQLQVRKTYITIELPFDRASEMADEIVKRLNFSVSVAVSTAVEATADNGGTKHK